MKTNTEIFEFLAEIQRDARDELSECRSAGDSSSYAAGYEKGRIDLVNEIKEFLANLKQ